MNQIFLLVPIFLVSCAYGSRSLVHPDGSKEKQQYAQIGGKGGYISTPEGFIIQVDLERSFTVAATAATLITGSVVQASLEKAKDASQAVTNQTAIKATTEQTKIKAAQSTATSVGNNPEANSGAINAIGNLFK